MGEDGHGRVRESNAAWRVAEGKGVYVMVERDMKTPRVGPVCV